MINPVAKLYMVFFTFSANLVVVTILGTYVMHLVWYPIFTLVFVMLPLYVLSSKDALEYISSSSTISSSKKALVWLIACLPVLISIILWVLCSVFLERQPEFIVQALVGGFGIGPAILFFGLYCLKSLLVRRKNY